MVTCFDSDNMADAVDTPFGGDGASLNTSEVTSSSVDSPKTLNTLSASPIDKRRKAPTRISSLPVELLVIIFREIYKSCRSRYEWNPWALASVCPSWEAAIHLTPEFWMHLTFSLDAWDFSAAFVASILVRSHNLIIQEVTFTRNIRTAEHDEHERARVMMAMQAVAPHIHRCRAITFNVRFSSSLPAFPTDFHGNAKHLRSLKLNCLKDDGGGIPTVSQTNLLEAHRERFQCPNLHTLVIDGRNYFNACQRNDNFLEMFPLLSALSISHFTPVASRSESFTTSALVRPLIPFQYKLAFFGISDVHLDDSPPVVDNDNSFDFNGDPPEHIVFQNVRSTDCMNQILELLGDPKNLHIIYCCLGRFDTNCKGTVSLKDIDIGEDLAEFLSNCLAKKLIIGGCPGLDDEVLDAMMTGRFGANRQMRPYASRYVKDLSIINCVDFSISTLKNLVKTRRTQSTWKDPTDIYDAHQPTEIRSLRLSGRVPYVSPEDQAWFKGFLSGFSYDPIQ